MMEKNAKIYVAGHRGMVGSAIVRELERQGYTNIITRTHKELDLTVAGTTAEAVAAGLADYYKDAATVKVHALNESLPENGLYSNAMAGTDRMELYLTVNAAGDQMMLVSLFDNLGKGSSGAAVQCMNLMLGLPETEGLE